MTGAWAGPQNQEPHTSSPVPRGAPASTKLTQTEAAVYVVSGGSEVSPLLLAKLLKGQWLEINHLISSLVMTLKPPCCLLLQ